MKFLRHLTFAFILFISACGSDDDTSPEPCKVTTLASTLPGKWKLANSGNIVEFKSDKSYTDASKALHSCIAGIWAAITNDTKIEMICGGSSFKEIRVNKIVCDTVQLQLSGIGPVNMVRQ